MSSCQAKVFKLIADSSLPLSTENIIQHLDYSEVAIRKSITNLRRREFIESTQFRYFLTDKGKQYFSTDPNLTHLDSTVGSYSTQYTNGHTSTKSEFIEEIIREAAKSKRGQWMLANVEAIQSQVSSLALMAPWVAFFAIQAGLIKAPIIIDSETDPVLDDVNERVSEAFMTYFN